MADEREQLAQADLARVAGGGKDGGGSGVGVPTCWRCGSTRYISLERPYYLKCLDCGYTWTALELAQQGG